MQPNQPDQNTQPPAGSPGTNVPEFLHLDPVVDPGIGAKKTKRRFIAVISILVVVIVTAITLYWLLVVNSAQELFYQSLEKSMSTSYVSRQFELKATDASIALSANAVSDFSNPKAPKSAIGYTYSIANKTDQGSVVKTSIAAKEIAGDGSKLAFNYSQLTGLKLKGITTGQWYSVPQDNNILVTQYDSLNLRSLFNTPFSTIPVGNFGADKTQQILNYIKAADIYKIQDRKAENLNGKNTTVLTLNTTKQSLVGLVNDIAKLFDTTPPATPLLNIGDIGMIKIWIQDDTKEIVKQTFQIKANSMLNISTAISYPNSAQAAFPANTIEIRSEG